MLTVPLAFFVARWEAVTHQANCCPGSSSLLLFLQLQLPKVSIVSNTLLVVKVHRRYLFLAELCECYLSTAKDETRRKAVEPHHFHTTQHHTHTTHNMADSPPLIWEILKTPATSAVIATCIGTNSMPNTLQTHSTCTCAHTSHKHARTHARTHV